MAATDSQSPTPIDPSSLKNKAQIIPQPTTTPTTSSMKLRVNPTGEGANVSLSRQVFNKDDFNKSVKTGFTQLISTQDPSFFDINLATIEDFFTLYDKFFYEIPKEGDTNSHTFLITESSEFVNFNPNQEEIEALLEEITDLREENLELRQELVQTIQSVQDFKDGAE